MRRVFIIYVLDKNNELQNKYLVKSYDKLQALNIVKKHLNHKTTRLKVFLSKEKTNGN